VVLIPVILAGGSGERLWPLSRHHTAKPFIDLFGFTYTLFQETLLRVQGLSEQAPIIVCNEVHRFLVAQQLQELSIKNASIMLEPVGRNTAPAITLAALEAKRRHQQDDDSEQECIMLVLPADHLIKDLDAFSEAIKQSIEVAKEGGLVTFGIEVTRPETGYGYIQSLDGVSVTAFIEKPDKDTAQRYYLSGEYLWNSGMFVFKPECYLIELALHQAQIHQSVSLAYQERKEDLDFIRIDEASFLACPSESIDYALMEKTERAKVVAYRGDWSDVGSWEALFEYAEKDERHNALMGDVMLESTSNSLVRAESRLVATVGVDNLVVIETADAVLVMDKQHSQGLKKIVQRIQASGREEHRFHKKVHRPWGSYEIMAMGERYKVKRIVVRPGGKLSVQMHYHRAEHWVVVSGSARVYKGNESFLLSENESTYIPLGETHSLENPGEIALELIEVQSGGYLGEDDIVRFHDRYGR